ncbi:MAG: C10 family peptidase [Muribaculaceae bacterium]|nr:C10 family peptidase [Muribaculaceae bacterium]
MRKIFTLSLLLAATAASARQISPDEALSAANAFLNKGTLTPVEASGAVTRSDAQPYYAFNATDGNGFVIISGDDRFSKVLGYSDRGSFDFKHMPPQLKAMLDQFAENSAKPSNWNGTHSSWNNSFSATRADEGVLLETAKWGQDAPYNADCPNMGESNAPTGCVATAMAIVMKYHNWPETYNWDAMPMEITEEHPAPNPELARLMKDAGEAVYMEYGPYESGAYVNWIGHRLQQVFKYSPDCQFITRQNFEDDQWVSMLKSNIADGNPVIYNGIGSGNHVFIVDGYNADEYHINWGWDGWYDGYYALDALTPNDAQDFSNNQGMIMNIVPDKSGKEYSDWFIDYGYLFAALPNRLTISVVDVKPGEVFHVGGISPQVPANFKGEYGIALLNKDGEIKEVLKTASYFNDGAKLVSFSWAFTDLIVKGDVSPTDKLQLVSKAEGDSNYKLILGTIENPSYLSVVNNTPVTGKIKFDIEEGIDFSYSTGINDRERIFVSPGTSEVDLLQGLLFEYSCSPNDLTDDSRIILSIKGKLIYGDQLYAFKGWFGTFFEIYSDYEISAKKVTLKDLSLEIPTAGTLKDLISKEESLALRSLTLTGNINATDFWYIRDNCPALEYLDIRKVNIEAESAIDDKIFTTSGENPENVIPEFALQALQNLKTLILPENIVGIASDSLGGLNLTGITIPKGVSFIGINVLFSNSNLEYVCLLNPEPVQINDCVFTGTLCPDNGTLLVPVGSIEKYKSTPVWKDFKDIREGTLPDVVAFTTVKDGVKFNCKFATATVCGYEGEPKEVIIPETFVENGLTITVTGIEREAFRKCESLESVTIPNSVTELGMDVFNGCKNLKTVILSEAMTVIPEYTFYGCKSLKEITFGSNIKEIGPLAFCASGLESITLPENITLGDYAFGWSEQLRTVAFKGNTQYNSLNPFEWCRAMENFIIDSDEMVNLDGFNIDQWETINIFTSSTVKNFTYSDPCVVYVPGQCADVFMTKADNEVREMWRYNINRKEGIFEIVPQIEGLAIDKVTINDKVVAPQDGIYKLDGASTQDIKVDFTLLGRQKMSTHYTSEFNATVADAKVSGVGEIISSDITTADVYSIDGMIMLRNASKEQINTLPNGIYIIREGNETRKIVVRN